MIRNSNTTGYPPKSVYRTPLTTGGQTLVVSSGGGAIDVLPGGKFYMPVVSHSSNSTDISNYGAAVLTSTMDITMRLDAPVSGSYVKLIMASSIMATDNAVYKIVVTTDDGRIGRIGSSGRAITFSTNVFSKSFKYMELVGTTNLRTKAGIKNKAIWLIAGASPSSIVPWTVSTSTA